MATIVKRHGKYLARVRTKNIDTSKTFRTAAEAKAWAAQTETDANNRSLGIVPKHITLGDIITRYKNEVTPGKRSARSEAIRLERFLRYKICNIPATDLQPHHFAEWRDERLKHVQGSSVTRELSTLSAVLNHAVKEWQYAKDNPILKISRPKENPPRTRRPTQEEARRICAYLEYDEDTPPTLTKQRVALAFLYAMETGMRAGEICSIQPHNIHLSQKYVHLDITKNGSSRDVPQNRRALEILQKLIPLKFEHTFGLNSQSLDAIFRRATKALEIDDLHFHDSRREALTRMAKKVNVMDLAKISGHKDVKILLNTYYAPNASSLADLLD